MNTGFQQTLDQIRAESSSSTQMGTFFERLMKRYFLQDPLYSNRFSNVYLWSEWADTQPNFTRQDTGVDIVAEERAGGGMRYSVQVLCTRNPDFKAFH